MTSSLHLNNRGTNAFLPVRSEDDVNTCMEWCLAHGQAGCRLHSVLTTSHCLQDPWGGFGRRKGPLLGSQILSLWRDPSLERSWNRLGFRFHRLHAMSHFQEKKRACWKKKTDSEGILGIQQFLGNSIWANIIESATLGSGFHWKLHKLKS